MDYQIIVYEKKLFRTKIKVYGMYTVEEAFEARYDILEDLGKRDVVEVVRVVDEKEKEG